MTKRNNKTTTPSNSGKKYTEQDNKIILEGKVPDAKIAKQLGRTEDAIETKRSRLLNE